MDISHPYTCPFPLSFYRPADIERLSNLAADPRPMEQKQTELLLVRYLSLFPSLF